MPRSVRVRVVFTLAFWIGFAVWAFAQIGPTIAPGVTAMSITQPAPFPSGYELCVGTIPTSGVCPIPVTVDNLNATPTFILPSTVPLGDLDLILAARWEGGRVYSDPTRFHIVGAPGKPVLSKRQ